MDVTDYYDNYRDYDNNQNKQEPKHDKILIYYDNSSVKNRYKMEFNIDIIFKNGETRNFTGVAKIKKHLKIDYMPLGIPFYIMMFIAFRI